MAIKEVEISQSALKAIENSGIDIKSITNDEFISKINEFIIKGAEKNRHFKRKSTSFGGNFIVSKEI